MCGLNIVEGEEKEEDGLKMVEQEVVGRISGYIAEVAVYGVPQSLVEDAGLGEQVAQGEIVYYLLIDQADEEKTAYDLYHLPTITLCKARKPVVELLLAGKPQGCY